MYYQLTSFQLSISKLILLTAAFFTLFLNQAFFRNAFAVYGAEPGGLLFISSLAVFLFATTVLVLSLLCFRYLTKPVLISVILGAALASYYMNRFNIVIDTTMLTNIAETDSREVRDLLTPGLLLEFLLLGLLPAALIFRTRIQCSSFRREILQRLKLAAFAFVLLLGCVAAFSSYYTSFFREHKLLRYYSNPVTYIYSVGKYLEQLAADSRTFTVQALGLDAHIPAYDMDRELIILVVGEAVRADHFGLNGYERQTTPLLAQENVINFPQVYSCGTSTAYSLPCMFSLLPRSEFDPDAALQQENLLDVLTHAGVQVLWRDNNSDSKGVAKNVSFEDFRNPEMNPVCDEECRDIGMLQGLDSFIAQHPSGDLVIVLHQMGNHGPAYYRRFPPQFARYTPYCQSNQLELCTDEEISNAYDNAILYTDYFLQQVIAFLKTREADFQTAMYYMSDHGESLGEKGLYLHGLPYLMAPENQKHVASLLWFGDNYRVDTAAVKAKSSAELSHDNYFHTVLGLMEINTSLYDPTRDLIVHN